jgi:hypothetical protein
MRTISDHGQLIQVLAEHIRKGEPQLEVPAAFVVLFDRIVEHVAATDGTVLVRDDDHTSEAASVLRVFVGNLQKRKLVSRALIDFVDEVYAIGEEGGDQIATVFDAVEASLIALKWPPRCMMITPFGISSRKGFERRAGVKVRVTRRRELD